MHYQDFIENTESISEIDSTTSSGDLDYKGMTLEINKKDGEELFHFITDIKGELQILFYNHDDYRMSVKLLERIILKAKEVVKVMSDPSQLPTGNAESSHPEHQAPNSANEDKKDGETNDPQ